MLSKSLGWCSTYYVTTTVLLPLLLLTLLILPLLLLPLCYYHCCYYHCCYYHCCYYYCATTTVLLRAAPNSMVTFNGKIAKCSTKELYPSISAGTSPSLPSPDAEVLATTLLQPGQPGCVSSQSTGKVSITSFKFLRHHFLPLPLFCQPTLKGMQPRLGFHLSQLSRMAALTKQSIIASCF